MNIQVYPHRIILNKTNEVNSGEYNVNECTFEFSQEYDGLTKIAVFSLCDGTTKNVTILNNQCIIPVECLQETGQVQIGVYGYATQDNELVLRYSPTPQNFVVRLGSYKEGTQPVAPTPTDWEILVEQVSDIAEDVSSIHEDITGINGEISGINIDIRDLQDTKANISDLAEVAFTGEFSDLKNIPSYATTQQLNQEIQDRQDADVNLQSQIDAISVSSDVVDVVGTYQELLDYDTTHLKDNDIVKVLQDSTHSDALSYYRWDKETSTWSYVGSEGPFYTKSETDSLLNDKQDVIDIDNMLSSDLVDDTNSTNKFVTQADITNWNNKEDKSNKVTEINSSSTDTQYPSAKCVYDSQEEQNEKIAELEMLYNAFPTVSDEDTTIQLDNTAKVKFREIDLKGNTSQVVIPEEQGTSVSNTSIYVSDVNTDKEHTIELSGNTYQETTTGKNILPQDKYIASQTINGITYTNNGDGTFDLNGTATANTSLRIIDTGIFNLESGQRYYLYSSVAYNSTTFNMSIVTTESGTQKFLIANSNYTPSTTPTNSRLQFYIASGNTVNVQKVKLMLVKGADDTSYEPFTNGASPNPSYPQNIEVVTGENNITIEGKNLFNPTYEVETQYDINGNVFSTNRYILNNDIISIDKSNNSYGNAFLNKIYLSTGTYTFSCNVSQANNTTSQARLKIQDWTNSSSIVASKSVNISSGKIEQTFEVSSNAEIGIMLIPNQNSDGTLYLSNIQLEKSSTITTYEAYTGTTYPVNLGDIELCKIDTYQDRIYKQNDKWYLEKNIGKVVLNGSESWTTQKNTSPYVFALSFDNYKRTQENICKCNYFESVVNSGYGDLTDGKICFRYNSGDNNKYLYICTTLVSSYIDFQTWLSTHNTTVYYVLTTPTTTEITDTNLVNQLNALYNATIYPITNINTDTSNLLPYIDLHYNFITPSPSPSRPSVVNVVKGENTITISNSDNTESQNYPINLGDMELCKIGTYQDYIYESNGNWYKKGNINKVTFNGSENWSKRTDIVHLTNTSCFRGSYSSEVNGNALQNTPQISNRFVCLNDVTDVEHIRYTGVTNYRFQVFINKSRLSSDDETGFKTWLSTHNTIVYYVLETPTDTQITDTTLITQLNNIKKAYSYDTQTNISQTNTDKPFIIYAEAIRSLKDVFE